MQGFRVQVFRIYGSGIQSDYVVTFRDMLGICRGM